MWQFFRLWIGALVRVFRSRQTLLLENLALRQQLTVFQRRHPRPRLEVADKFFWVFARQFWSDWKNALIVVTPETVVRWHRTGFRLYCSVISRARKRVGRRKVSKEVRGLIFQMVAENPTWGAPRIHGELLLLGFNMSERTISRWMKRAPRDPQAARRLRSFLRNHREAIAAMDFFTVPTITFGVLYCFFIIGHDRRRILHFNVNSPSHWRLDRATVAQSLSLRSADHDAKYGAEVPAAIRSMSLRAVRTAVACPWQNGVAERWVGSCRRELLDHVIAINESHLKRLLASYVDYYHQDRTHCGLQKQTPQTRTCCSGQRESDIVASCRRSSSSLRTRRLRTSPQF